MSAPYNGTCPLDTDSCTLDTCPIQCAHVHFLPTVPGNAIYAVIFGILLVSQLFFGIKYKTWGFMVGMVCGLLLEVIGYAGRIMMHNNPFDFNGFIIYLVPLTIGPAFLAGAIYLTLGRIIIAHGAHISRFSPRVYSLTFMTADFLSLVLQGAGGGLSATADDQDGSNLGRNIMIAGVVIQVVFLGLFMILFGEFSWRLRGVSESNKDVRFVEARATRRFRWLKYAVWGATFLIFVRSVYRVAELQQGFDGPIAQNEPLFMVLEGPMIFLAVGLLTVLHPGYCFGSAANFAAASWSLRGRKAGPSVDGEELMAAGKYSRTASPYST